MRSFGWDFTIQSTPQDKDIDEERSKYTPEQVEWYRLRLPDPENGLKHDISFNYYIPPESPKPL